MSVESNISRKSIKEYIQYGLDGSMSVKPSDAFKSKEGQKAYKEIQSVFVNTYTVKKPNKS
jgi:hypothetical protein